SDRGGHDHRRPFRIRRRFPRPRNIAAKRYPDRPGQWTRGADALRQLCSYHAIAAPRSGSNCGPPRPLRRVRAGPVRAEAAAPAKRSFPPIIGAQARVLVLGTLPGEESLRRREYYAHPRNLFWPIIFALFDTVPTTDYAQRIAFVMAH